MSHLEEFKYSYYHSLVWTDMYWLGCNVLKYPTDLWNYQEIMFEIRPDLIIETGTFNGGSALFLASMCDLMGKGQVVTIDIEHKDNLPIHNRIKYILGDSTSKKIVEQIADLSSEAKTVLVILDSDHTKDHVLKEIECYRSFVTSGSYLIVEDTHINGHPVHPYFGPGPMEAVQEFLSKNDEFVVDERRERFMITANPSGYLRKK